MSVHETKSPASLRMSAKAFSPEDGPSTRSSSPAIWRMTNKRETYDIVRDMLGDWLPKCKLLLGNHDSRPFILEAFPELAPSEPDFFTFTCRVGNWQLIGLDSHIAGAVEGSLGERQLAWLGEELRSHADQRRSCSCIIRRLTSVPRGSTHSVCATRSRCCKSSPVRRKSKPFAPATCIKCARNE